MRCFKPPGQQWENIMDEDKMRIDVYKCSGCGKNHSDVELQKNDKELIIDKIRMDYHYYCPVKKDKLVYVTVERENPFL